MLYLVFSAANGDREIPPPPSSSWRLGGDPRRSSPSHREPPPVAAAAAGDRPGGGGGPRLSQSWRSSRSPSLPLSLSSPHFLLQDLHIWICSSTPLRRPPAPDPPPLRPDLPVCRPPSPGRAVGVACVGRPAAVAPRGCGPVLARAARLVVARGRAVALGCRPCRGRLPLGLALACAAPAPRSGGHAVPGPCGAAPPWGGGLRGGVLRGGGGGALGGLCSGGRRSALGSVSVAAAPTATAAGAAAVTAACGMAALGLFAVLVATMVAHTATSLHRGEPVARVGEVQAKAWTATSADATPSLEASFLHLLASARRVL